MKDYLISLLCFVAVFFSPVYISLFVDILPIAYERQTAAFLGLYLAHIGFGLCMGEPYARNVLRRWGW